MPLRALGDLSGYDAAKVAEVIRGVLPEPGILVLDRELRVVLMEGSVFPRHVYDLALAEGRDIRDVIPAVAWAHFGQHWEAALAGESRTIESPSPDGHGVYAQHFAPLTTDHGVAVGAITVFLDVTERARERDSLERRLAQQSAVSSIGSLALRPVGLATLLQEAADVLHSALGADVAAVYEHTPDGGAIVRAGAGERVVPPPVATDATRQSFALIRDSGQPVLSTDIRNEKRFSSPVLESQGMVSLVAAPIGAGAGAFGFLGACSRTAGAFSQGDLAFVQSVANVLSGTSERERAHDRAAEREEQLNHAQRIAWMGSWESDLVSRRFTSSAALRSMLGLDSLTPSFADVFARVHPDDRALVEGKFNAASADLEPTEFRVILRDGSVRTFCSHVEPVIEDGRFVLVRGMVQDITVQHAGELALRRSEECFRQGFDNAPIAMALVDPASRRFVRVNDALCRFLDRSADELAALTVMDVTHPGDGETGFDAMQRLGSGELAEHTCEKRYVRPDGSLVWGALSVSTALDADGSVDVMFAQIVDITERKLREDSIRAELGEVAWLKEIRQAFEEDRFELHAQPIIDIATGEIVKHELLIRMRDRDGGLVAPGEFLPAAEKYGLILEVDRWVISKGAEMAARGMDVAINVSGVSLTDPTLVAHIDSELARTKADPSRLDFEITETALIAAGGAAARIAQQLRERGFRFALDDFGTGFGGFHHLKTLPLDCLKIDQEFVRDAVANESDRHVISTVVNLAKRFGLQTVAEGVEDQQTLDLLAELGVDRAQGFHLGRPAPLDGP